MASSPVILRAPRKAVVRARALRKTMSLPEILLWRQLRMSPGGHRFRKQMPLPPYTLDFACLDARLIVEVDGAAHDMGNNSAHDAVRDAFTAAQGFRTLRVPAADVLRRMDDVLTAIVNACDDRRGLAKVGAVSPPPPLRGGPPPRAGEE